MFEDFLNHRCNIFHLAPEEVTVGYGIMAEDTKEEDKSGSLLDIPCHFHIRSQDTVKIVQHEPHSSAEGDVKLSLPYGTDIRKNDVVEDCRTGLRYRADIPREIHGSHHIIVKMKRAEGVKAAI